MCQQKLQCPIHPKQLLKILVGYHRVASRSKHPKDKCCAFTAAVFRVKVTVVQPLSPPADVVFQLSLFGKTGTNTRLQKKLTTVPH